MPKIYHGVQFVTSCRMWTVIGSDSFNDDEWWVLSLMNNVSAVISYLVLNSRHNTYFSVLRSAYSIYSRCRKWERVGMEIELMGKWEWEWSVGVEMGMEWFDGSGKGMGTRKSFPHTYSDNVLNQTYELRNLMFKLRNSYVWFGGCHACT